MAEVAPGGATFDSAFDHVRSAAGGLAPAWPGGRIGTGTSAKGATSGRTLAVPEL